jgi:hypothetical protein
MLANAGGSRLLLGMTKERVAAGEALVRVKENRRSLGFARDDKGEGDCQRKEWLPKERVVAEGESGC